jgi:hypothetical protein
MPAINLEITDIHSAILVANPEADVIIVIIHSDGAVRVEPHWECKMTPSEVWKTTLAASMRFVEDMGVGHVTSHIIDLRNMTDDLRNYIIRSADDQPQEAE